MDGPPGGSTKGCVDRQAQHRDSRLAAKKPVGRAQIHFPTPQKPRPSGIVLAWSGKPSRRARTIDGAMPARLPIIAQLGPADPPMASNGSLGKEWRLCGPFSDAFGATTRTVALGGRCSVGAAGPARETIRPSLRAPGPMP